MALSEIIGDKVIKKGEKEGEIVQVETSSFGKDGYVVGLYFSAHWCPPCRAFTPKLADWYNKLKGGEIGEKFEIVFLSSDRDEKSFNEYFGEMPWHAVSYNNRDIKVSIRVMEGMKLIPRFPIRTLYHASTKYPEFLPSCCWKLIPVKSLQQMGGPLLQRTPKVSIFPGNQSPFRS